MPPMVMRGARETLCSAHSPQSTRCGPDAARRAGMKKASGARRRTSTRKTALRRSSLAPGGSPSGRAGSDRYRLAESGKLERARGGIMADDRLTSKERTALATAWNAVRNAFDALEDIRPAGGWGADRPVEKGPVPFKCPICDGTGLVSRPPCIPGDIESWSTASSGPYPCKACSGTGIVWRKS